MDIKLENFSGTGKNGNPFSCFKLHIGEFSTLLFPRSEMERNYLQKVIDEGLLNA